MSDHAKKRPRWKTGRTVHRTLYLDEKLVGLVDTPALATAIVDAMNEAASSRPQWPSPSSTRTPTSSPAPPEKRFSGPQSGSPGDAGVPSSETVVSPKMHFGMLLKERYEATAKVVALKSELERTKDDLLLDESELERTKDDLLLDVEKLSALRRNAELALRVMGEELEKLREANKVLGLKLLQYSEASRDALNSFRVQLEPLLKWCEAETVVAEDDEPHT